MVKEVRINFGKNHSSEAKALMSITKGTAIYIYSPDNSSLINTFSSARKALEFNVDKETILKYARDSNLIFKDKWKLSTSLIEKK